MLHLVSTFLEQLIRPLGQDGLPLLRKLQTIELPLAFIEQNADCLSCIQTRAKQDNVEPLRRVVIEVDGVPFDNFHEDFLDALEFVVPEVVVTNLHKDGWRWAGCADLFGIPRSSSSV